MPEKQYVIFRLGSEEYGINIAYVQEVIRYRILTQIPNTTIEGVINLRDKVTSIINLKKKFGIADEKVPDGSCRIIIVRVGDKQVGLIVDNVAHVVRIDEGAIEPIKSVIKGIDSKLIEGIAHNDQGGFIVLLNPEQIEF